MSLRGWPSGAMVVDVRFAPDYVRSTPLSGHDPGGRRSAAVDPQRKFTVLEEAEHWSLTTLREKLIKIGAKTVRHGRYVLFLICGKYATPARYDLRRH